MNKINKVDSRFSENLEISNYVLYKKQHLNNNSCRTYDTRLVSENSISMAENIVDVDSELKGLNLVNTYCAEKMHSPFKYKPQFINNKICNMDNTWNISTSYDCEDVNAIFISPIYDNRNNSKKI
jgi:hypothetical protein